MCGIDLDPQLIVIVFFHPRTAGFDILLGKAFIVLYLSGMLLSHIIEDWPISIWKVTVSAATQKKRQIIDPPPAPPPLLLRPLPTHGLTASAQWNLYMGRVIKQSLKFNQEKYFGRSKLINNSGTSSTALAAAAGEALAEGKGGEMTPRG